MDSNNTYENAAQDIDNSLEKEIMRQMQQAIEWFKRHENDEVIDKFLEQVKPSAIAGFIQDWELYSHGLGIPPFCSLRKFVAANANKLEGDNMDDKARYFMTKVYAIRNANYLPFEF